MPWDFNCLLFQQLHNKYFAHFEHSAFCNWILHIWNGFYTWFWQSGNESRWFLSKKNEKKTLLELETPPHHGKFHQKIPFAFSDCLPNQGSIHIFYKVLSEFKVTDMRGLWSYLNPIKMWTNSEKQLSSHCQAESAPQPLSSAFFNIEISNSTKSSNVTKFVLASLTDKVTSV